ncbi:MAG: ATP-binding protein [Myxococcales bacterium]|nr:ATP-binding protein [Myxococcales bacterium]
MSGPRFWGRAFEVAALTRLLREGAHVSLTAPRRIGKTSLMREVGERLRDEFTVLHVDLQRARSAADLIADLGIESRSHRNLWSRTREVFRNVLGSVEELEVDALSLRLRSGLVGDWQHKGERLLAEFAQASPDTIIFIDELPILVNHLLVGADHRMTGEGRQQAEDLLSWLRAASIRFKGKLRFVIAGSIGLAPILRKAKLSAALNTFTPFVLEPWDHATARGALYALAANYGVRWGEGAIEHTVTKLGCCVPHHVQLFWSLLHFDAQRRGVFHLQIADVDRVFSQRLLGSRGQAELSHFEERLRWVLGPALEPLCFDLLSEAAIVGRLQPIGARTLLAEHQPPRGLDDLREILDVLEHDGYLAQEHDGSYVFVSALVREWWRLRFSLSYTPLGQRGDTP